MARSGLTSAATRSINKPFGRLELSANCETADDENCAHDSRRTTILQYLLIYGVLLTGNSYLYSYFLEPYTSLFAVLLAALVIMFPKFWHFRDVVLVAFVLVLSLVVRCFAGGAGVGVAMRYAMTLALIVVAIKIDNKMFLTRMVRLICALSIVSTVMYFVRVAYPGLYSVLPLYEFASQGDYYSMITAGRASYYTKGLLLFCIRESETRAISIFTEPGLYQGVLTAALFIMLFMFRDLKVGLRERSASVVILLLGIVTCGSTTGFISTLILVGLYMISTNGRGRGSSLKRKLFLLCALGLCLLIVDYLIRGNQSILAVSFFDKLFNDTSNGAVRLDSVVASFELLFSNPLGVGFDYVQQYKGALSVGAGLFTTTAALGIAFAFGFLYWLLAPIIRSRLGFSGIVAWLALYFLFAVSQSLVLAPVLVAISVFFSLEQEGEEQK